MEASQLDKEFYDIIMYNYTLDQQYALRVWAEEMDRLYIVERINQYGREGTD